MANTFGMQEKTNWPPPVGGHESWPRNMPDLKSDEHESSYETSVQTQLAPALIGMETTTRHDLPNVPPDCRVRSNNNFTSEKW